MASILFVLSRKSFELGSSTVVRKEHSEDIGERIKLKNKLLPLVEKGVHRFKAVLSKFNNLLDSWIKSIRKYKRQSQDKKDHVLESSFDFSDESEIAVKPELEEAEDEVKPVENLKAEVNDTSVAKRRWKGLDFKRGAKSTNLRPRASSGSKEAVKKGVLLKDEKRKSPMISNSVVYPEARRRELQMQKKEEIKKEQLEEILVERIAQDPRDVEAYERLGDYYRQQGNDIDALSCYKYVLKLNPLNEKAKSSVDSIEGLIKNKR
ncbi:tetratricopeptide repeat protein [Patescibacteria group bacterium]